MNADKLRLLFVLVLVLVLDKYQIRASRNTFSEHENEYDDEDDDEDEYEDDWKGQ
jgi:hypothetical protein